MSYSSVPQACLSAGSSLGPASEAATAETAVQRQEQMQSAPKLPPSPETAGEITTSPLPAFCTHCLLASMEGMSDKVNRQLEAMFCRQA